MTTIYVIIVACLCVTALVFAFLMIRTCNKCLRIIKRLEEGIESLKRDAGV